MAKTRRRDEASAPSGRDRSSKGPLIVEEWEIERLKPYERNPRKNDPAVPKMVNAIKEFGFRIPVVARSDGLILDGHLRYKAAKEMGMATVPVALADGLSEDQIRAFRLLANKSVSWAEWDTALLAEELDLLSASGFDLGLTGFSEDELTKLAGGGSEPEIADGFDSAGKDTPDDLADTKFTFGQYSFKCDRDTYLEWQERLRQEIGFDEPAALTEIKQRLGL